MNAINTSKQSLDNKRPLSGVYIVAQAQLYKRRSRFDWWRLHLLWLKGWFHLVLVLQHSRINGSTVRIYNSLSEDHSAIYIDSQPVHSSRPADSGQNNAIDI